MKKSKGIGVLGLWHLGSVYSACLAKLGFDVTGYDQNSVITRNLNNGQPPIEEPFLTETIKKHLNQNLFFSSNPGDAITNKKFIFVTYDVPVDDQDNIDLSIVNRTFSEITKFVSPGTIVVVSSQVPIGYCRKSLELLRKKDSSVNIIYFPENLRLGTALESFLNPSRVVIGADSTKTNDRFEEVFSVLDCPFVKIGLESAEMTKHALNSYLALNISFSGELADLSETLGADMNEVVLALKSDSRISPKAPLNPGLGFAGGTLGRDIQTLRSLGKKVGRKTLLLDAVYEVNQERLTELFKKVKKFFPNLKDKKIGLLGLTYKPNTNTLRRSMSLEAAEKFKNEGSQVYALDPAIKESIESHTFIKIETVPQNFFSAIDFAILMTEWPEFRNLPWKDLVNKLKTKTIFDTKNFLPREYLEKIGYKYVGMGYPV